jgi:hypothetical protein
MLNLTFFSYNFSAKPKAREFEPLATRKGIVAFSKRFRDIWSRWVPDPIGFRCTLAGLTCPSRLFVELGNKLNLAFILKNSLKYGNKSAQAGIRTRVLRATAAYTRPDYTTWAISG